MDCLASGFRSIFSVWYFSPVRVQAWLFRYPPIGTPDKLEAARKRIGIGDLIEQEVPMKSIIFQ